MDNPHNLEEGGILVNLRNKGEQDVHSQMLETMRSLIAHLESIKRDNEKLLKEKVEKEEINEIMLRSLTERKQNKQTRLPAIMDKDHLKRNKKSRINLNQLLEIVNQENI